MQCWVSGGLGVVGDFEIDGGLTIGGSIDTTGAYISAGVPLHDIFSTDTDVHGDMTVHGSISSQDELTVGAGIDVSAGANIGGDTTITGGLTASNVTSPPGPLLLPPTERWIDPLRPADDSPVPITISPVFPASVPPEDT